MPDQAYELPAPPSSDFRARPFLSSALFKILLAAFLIRLVAAFPVHASGFGADEKEFLFLAHQIADGKGFVDSNGDHSIRAPLYPALISLCVLLAPSSLILPFLFTVVPGTVSVYAGYLFARDFWRDERVALTAAGILAFFPALVIYGSMLMSESLFIPLFLLALFLARRLRTDDRPTTHVLFALVSALAVLTRAVFFGVFPILVAALWFLRHRAGIPLRRLLFAVAVWCLLLLPWTLRNYTIHHAFVPVSTFGGRSLLIGSNPFAHGTTKLDPGFFNWLAEQLAARGSPPLDSLSEEAVSAAEQSIALWYIAAHPLRALELSVEKGYVFWIYPLSNRSQEHPLQAVLMACDMVLWLGVIAGTVIARRKRVSMFPVWIVVAFFTAMHVVLHAEARYRLPLVPLLCVLAAGAARVPLHRGAILGDRRVRRALIAACISLALLYGIAAWLVAHGSA